MNKPAFSMTRLDHHSAHRVDRDVPLPLASGDRPVEMDRLGDIPQPHFAA